MNLIDIWDSKTKIAIHCSTADQANALFSAFDAMNADSPRNPKRLISRGQWYASGGGTCYTNQGCYCYLQYYIKQNTMVISFDEIEGLGVDDNIPKDLTLQFNELMSS